MAGDGRDQVIFLEKNQLFIYDGGGIERLEIPVTLIRDCDVIDKSGFDSLVNDFIRTQKIVPSRFWMVLSESICFSKEFNQPDASKLEEETRDFLEAVPFDQILSKKYKGPTGIRMIATNLEFVEAVSEIFERNGFGLAATTPAALFAGFNTRKVLDTDFVKNILANKSLMKQGNMLGKVEAPAPTPEAPAEAKKRNKMLPYLIVGFVVLLGVLGVMLYFRFAR